MGGQAVGPAVDAAFRPLRLGEGDAADSLCHQPTSSHPASPTAPARFFPGREKTVS